MRHNRLTRSIALLLTVMLIGLCWTPSASAQEKAEPARTQIGREDHAFVELPAFVRPAEPTIKGTCAILVELNSGAILYAKNMNQRIYPASTTKVLTAMMAIENLPLDGTLTLSYNSTHDLISGGFDYRMQEGQVYTIEEALYGTCLNSVNTLAYALAEEMGGSIPGFAAMMNTRAAELGALNTTFTNPHGLNDLDHLTTAYDMAKIMWGAIELDDYRRIAGTAEYTCAEPKSGQTMTFPHTIRFLQPGNSWYDSRVVCAKSGWTEDARFCRAVYASDGQLDLICIVLHSTGADDVDADVRSLLNYGFDNFSLKNPPVFGEGSILGGNIRDENGVSQKIYFVTAEGTVMSGGKILVPNTYADMNWRLDLSLKEQNLVGYGSLGGVPLVEYPIFMVSNDEVTTKAEYFPTATAPQPVTPGTQESSSADASRSQEGATVSPEGQEEGNTGNLFRLALIICGAFLLLCLIALIFTLSQNSRLRKRMKRRNALRK